MFDFLRTFSKLKDKMPAYTTTAEPQNYLVLEALIFSVSTVPVIEEYKISIP